MPTCKECEWFICLDKTDGICCCPDRPKDGLPAHFPYEHVNMGALPCIYFSREDEEMFEDTNNEKAVKESKIMAALEEHKFILEDVQNFVDQLFQQFAPVLEESVFESLKQVDKKLATGTEPVSDIPLVREIHQLDNKLIRIAEYLQTLSRHAGV
jgi:hypothetical protein